MKPRDLHRLVAAGESERVEFKSAIRSSSVVARILTGFLNRAGGQLVVGISDRGELLGVKNAAALVKRLKRELAELITPPALWSVESFEIDGRQFVVAEVSEGRDKPYVTGGAIFIRRGAQDVSATREEISRLIQDRSTAGGRWERQIAMGADVSDLDVEIVRETAEMAITASRWRGDADDPESFLHSHGLLESGRITNAAVLLFAKEPTRFLPQARVRVVVMPHGKTGDDFESDRMFDSCLLRVVEEIEPFLEGRIGGVSVRFADEGYQRRERISYPRKAIREGVLNAIVHRDYRASGSILISVRPDLLGISNPGGLPEGLTPAALKREHPSIPVNPDIAHVCYLQRLIELVGRGTEQIVEECRRLKLRVPKWDTSPTETTLTFFAPAHGDRRAQERLSPRQIRILEILREERLSAPDLVRSLPDRVTARTIRSDLKMLVELGLVVTTGQARSVTYSLSEAGRLRSS